MLVQCLALYEHALVASFAAVYQSRWTDWSPLEAADLAVWLPAGAPLWRATGGPLALTPAEHTLRLVEYRLQVLAWQHTKDGQSGANAPKPPKPVPYEWDADLDEAHALRQAAARQRRLKRSS